MPSWKLLVCGALASGLVACGDDGDAPLSAAQQLARACYPVCNAERCMACDTSMDEPVCVSVCGPNLACQDGQCVAPGEQTCEPACGPCQTCDTSGDAPVCADNCGATMECVAGRCQPPTCDPPCLACQFCDISGAAPTCVDTCGAGTQCSAGACVPLPGIGCEPACGPCALCDTSSGEGVCVELCAVGETCDAGICRRDTVHTAMPELDVTFDSPQAVTAECIHCHPNAAAEMLSSPHWRWRGATPDMRGYESNTDQGKATVINNFCIATRSNEKRCTVCHAGYGWVDDTYDFDDTSKMDCLVCHASPDSGYAKDFQTASGVKDGVDLTIAAKSAGRSTRQSCGRCHFGAGGGDNVKKGDIGSELSTPTPAADVHMGRGFTCADCHDGGNHQLLGQGVHNIVREGSERVACADCHTDQPHDQNLLDDHVDDLACQTCHVPAFSRQQPTKVDWDWSTAGNKYRNVEKMVVGSREVDVYNWKKGDFVWQQEVRPSYAWHDGEVDRMTTSDTYEETGAPGDPIQLAFPLALGTDPEARIFPFKIMRGKQAADPVRRLVIVPKLYGPGGFWGSVPAPYDAAAVEAVWDNALTLGAQAAGQIAAGDSYTTDPWEWLSTEMYMQINHEVAPAADAVDCLDCHQEDFADTFFPWADLGYTCDPATATGCGPARP